MALLTSLQWGDVQGYIGGGGGGGGGAGERDRQGAREEGK